MKLMNMHPSADNLFSKVYITPPGTHLQRCPCVCCLEALHENTGNYWTGAYHLTFSDSKIHIRVKGNAPGCDLWCRSMATTVIHGILVKGERSKYQGSIF